MTGIRPRAALTAMRTMVSCSARSRVGRFAGRAAYDQGAGAFLDLTIAKALERGDVDLIGRVERRRQGRRVA